MMEEKKHIAQQWFRQLRDEICERFETLEKESLASDLYSGDVGSFTRKPWTREQGGGGEMSLMRGRLFEKVGVNISTVEGEFSETFQKEMPQAQDDPRFWASGISLVAHMSNPHVPAVHMNTRMIITGDGGITSGKQWFGGGADLTPMFMPDDEMSDIFHARFKDCCDKHNSDYYEEYKAWCDRYFFLPHRNEPRGIGGIFYDYLNTGDWDADLAFTQDVGKCLRDTYPEIVCERMLTTWSEADRAHQLQRRGRYVEFNLLHDRGTRFGIMTDGNAEAILMSLPPEVTW